MKAMIVIAMAAVLAGCSRKVDVQTAPAPSSEVGIDFTNNATQAVNVYVVSGGNDIYVAQVPEGTTKHLIVSGVALGANVTLKARTVDGEFTYTKPNVVLSGSVPWTVP